MTETPTRTFYAATAVPAPRRPALAQDLEAEICVVGGGFAGLWAARALQKRGHEVVLLEAKEIGSGASGQNGGFVSAGFAERLPKIVARVGLAPARSLYRLSRDGVEIVRAFAAENQASLLPKPGRLHVLRYNDEVGLLDEAEMLARDFGHAVEVWPTEKVRRALRSGQYYQAIHETDAFHLHPLNLARLLAADFEKSGGRIFEQSQVIEADLGGLRKSLTTDTGRVRAFNVVLAGSAALGGAFPQLANRILPVRTHVAVTAPLGKRLQQAIRYDGAVSDTRRAGDYYRLIGDRLLWGGRITTKISPPRDVAKLMANDIAGVFPQLADAPIEYAWSGTMGYAVHKMPQLGMVLPGVWIASAFGGQGLNTTAMAGDLIASAISEHDERWRQFIPFGLVWAGGSAGRALTQASYWAMQANDRLDEAHTRAVERDQAAAEAGLKPGLAAHVGRTAKRRWLESLPGRVTIRLIAAAKRAFARAGASLAAAGRRIYVASGPVGRALAAAVWFVAERVIGPVARAVGTAMDTVAEWVTAAARATVRAGIHFWTAIFVPGAIRAASATRKFSYRAWVRGEAEARRFSAAVAALARRTWRNVIVPASIRFSESANAAGGRAKAGSIKFLEHAKRSSVAIGAAAREKIQSVAVAWSGKAMSPEEESAAEANPVSSEESVAAGKEEATKAETETFENEKPKKKKKKAKEKKSSVEA